MNSYIPTRTFSYNLFGPQWLAVVQDFFKFAQNRLIQIFQIRTNLAPCKILMDYSENRLELSSTLYPVSFLSNGIMHFTVVFVLLSIVI